MKVLVLVLALITISECFQTRYFLYKKDNPEQPIQVTSQNAASHLKRNIKTLVFIHGYSKNQKTSVWYQRLKKAYFARDDYNIIQTDYAELSAQHFPIALLNVPNVGADIGNFIIALTKGSIPLDSIEVVGHSLGGQIAGFVGKRIIKQLNQKLPRITALDPGSVLIPYVVQGTMINKADAKVVVIVYTARNIYNLPNRDYIDSGSTIFYPNDGNVPQPGCPILNIPDVQNNALFCSHERSYWYFLDAVTHPGSMVAQKCGNYNDYLTGKCKGGKKLDLGGEITAQDGGGFYMRTTPSRPFRSV